MDSHAGYGIDSCNCSRQEIYRLEAKIRELEYNTNAKVRNSQYEIAAIQRAMQRVESKQSPLSDMLPDIIMGLMTGIIVLASLSQMQL